MATLDEYRKRPHWSYSSINGFVNICSLQWAFSHIMKIPPAFTPLSLCFGTVFHRTLEWVNMVRLEGNTPGEAEASDLFHTLWKRQQAEDRKIKFDKGTDSESCAAQGRQMIACMVDSMDPAEEVVTVNQAFAVPLIDATGNVLEKPLIGEIDCVVANDNETTLVDWKTSANRWPKKKAGIDMQPTAFVYAYGQLHGEIPSFRFDVVVKNKTPVFEQHVTHRSQDQFNRFVELVKLVEAMVEHEHWFPSEQGFYCAGCPYKEPCRAWHRDRARCIRVAA